MNPARFFEETPTFIDVGHAEVPHWAIGQGPDLFFVHGWPLHGATWRCLVPHLAPHYTCHIIDLPTTGQSRWDEHSKVSFTAHARTIMEVIDQVGLQDYALIGHDSGALLARLVAAEHTTRVKGLVMGNTEIPGHVPLMLKVLVLGRRMPGGTAAFRGLLKSRLLRRSGLGYKGCFTDLDWLDGEFKDLFIDPVIQDRRTLEGQMRLLDEIDHHVMARLTDTHQQITAPTALIWGTDDPWFPLQKARGMLDQFPGGATLHELPGGKLFAHEDHAEAFAAFTRRHLDTCFALESEQTKAGKEAPQASASLLH